MSAREGISRDGASSMSVDEALAYADRWTINPLYVSGDTRAFRALAAEVRSLREQNSRLRELETAASLSSAHADYESKEFERLTSPALVATEGSDTPVFDMEAAVEAYCVKYWEGDWPGLFFDVETDDEIRARVRPSITAALPHLQPDMEALRRELESLRGLLSEVSPWMHAAYDRPPQTPDTVSILQKLDGIAAQAGKQGGERSERELFASCRDKSLPASDEAMGDG